MIHYNTRDVQRDTRSLEQRRKELDREIREITMHQNRIPRILAKYTDPETGEIPPLWAQHIVKLNRLIITLPRLREQLAYVERHLSHNKHIVQTSQAGYR